MIGSGSVGGCEFGPPIVVSILVVLDDWFGDSDRGLIR